MSFAGSPPAGPKRIQVHGRNQSLDYVVADRPDAASHVRRSLSQVQQPRSDRGPMSLRKSSALAGETASRTSLISVCPSDPLETID